MTGRRDVGLFVTCVGDLVQPEVPTAAVRVLRASGATVAVPDGQTCCGQPAWNAGFVDEAARVAGPSLDALDRWLTAEDSGRDVASDVASDVGATVVVPAGSCATMIRKYWPQLFTLAGDPDRAATARRVAARTEELTEHLADRALPDASVAPCRVAVHQSCHLLRELHVTDGPRAAVERIEGTDVVDWPADDRCCGFGGTFSVKLPEASVAMADEKLDHLPPGTDVVVGADASCLLHLQARVTARGLPVQVRHVAELLAAGLDTDLRTDTDRDADRDTDRDTGLGPGGPRP